LGVRVFGVSLDDVATIAKFKKEQKLDFPLLSDPDGSAAAKYGVLPDEARYASRVTFVLDEKGILRLVDEQVSVATHGPDLVAKIRKAKAGAR
jgi:peroxiredoxin Q/BCP